MSLYYELVLAVLAYDGVAFLFSLKTLGGPAPGAFLEYMKKRGQ